MRKRVVLTIGAVAAGYALLLTALFWRVWLRGQMSGWDCVVEYWPDLVSQIHALRHGEWPMWNPYALGGYPMLADPQAGLFSPVNWLLWLGSVPFGDGAWLIQAKVLLGLWAALGGMHAWTWRRTGSHAAAVVAALVYVLGSPLLVHKNGALLWPMLYLPWGLLALERFVAHPSARRGAAVAAALWLMGTAGHPQSFFYALVVCFLYGGFLVLASPSPSPRAVWATVRRMGPGLIALGALAAALLAATWLPARDAVAASPRAHRGLGYVLGGALERGHLRELLVPGLDHNWQADVYVGMLPLVGGVWLLIAARRARERAEVGFWLAVGALGLALALGKEGHLLPWFATHVPGFDLFRIAYRHKLVFGLAAAVLAGDAAAALLAGDRARWTRWAWLALAAGWLAAMAATGWRAPAFAAAAAIAVVAAAPAWTASRPRLARATRWAAAAVVPALVLADLWHAGAGKLAILQRRPDAKGLVQLAAMSGAADTWRYHVGNMSSPYGGTVPFHVAFQHDVREWSGYINPIEPQRHADLERRAKATPAILAHFNVRWFAGHRKPPPGRTVAPGVVDIDDVAPVVRWYGGVEVTSDAQLLDALAATPPSATVVAYVEPDDVRGVALPAPAADGVVPAPVAGRVVSFARNAMVVDVDAPAAGVVVIAKPYNRGWTAELVGVDGARRAARLFRADHDLRAVVVPAGTWRIVLRYQPRGYVALVLAFFAGLAGLALAGLGRWRWLDAVPGGPR